MIFKKKEKELSIKDFKNPAKTYADMASQVNFYKVVILSLIIILGVTVFGLMQPPPFLRQDKQGRVEIIEDYSQNNQITDWDIRTFVANFTLLHNFENSFSIEQNAPIMLNMMTSRLRAEYKEKYINEKFIKNIMDSRAKSESYLDLKKISFSKNGQKVVGSVIFVRDITLFESSDKIRKTLRADFVIIETESRSLKAPYGMQVDEYSEVELKR
jgi:hypothetical protein